MKKIIALLLAMMMILCLFAGCAEEPVEEKKQDPVEDNTPVEEDPVEEEEQDPVEDNTPVEEELSDEPLLATWQQAGGTDTHIESPHRDNQSLLNPMLWENGYGYDNITGEYFENWATGWTASEDYTQFSMTLKDGMKWSDGSDIVIEDVVWNIHNAILNPNSSQSGSWQTVVGYDAFKEGTAAELEGMVVDGNTITITLNATNVTWGALRSIKLGAPASAMEGIAWADVDTSDYWKMPLSNGAFKVTEVSFPDYVVVERNEHYYGQPAGFKSAKLISYAAGGNEAAVAAMIAGEIDFGTRQIVLDGSVANNMTTQNPDIKWIKVVGGGVRIFNWRFQPRADGKETPWINDVRVRQAVDLLINQEMLSAFLPETTAPTYTLIGTNATEYNTEVPQVAYDPERAKELLDEAGWDYDTVIDLAYYYDDQITHDSMLALEQDFAAAGVQLNAFLMEGDLAAAIYTDANYDILLGMGSYDPINRQAGNYNQLTSAGSYTFLHNFGAAEFVAKYEPLVQEYDATADPEARKAIAWELQAMNAEDCYMMPGYVNANLVAYNSATIEVPVEYFEAGAEQAPFWHLWKVLK